MNDIWQSLGNVISLATGVLLLFACGVLWMRRHTSFWLLLALIGQALSVLCRLAFAVSPATFAAVPIVRLIWPLAAGLFAVGLLGYAWFEVAALPSTGVPAAGREPR
jgi:Na+-transporting NADH:ubiquinone oxidoreductase subunit NqrB